MKISKTESLPIGGVCLTLEVPMQPLESTHPYLIFLSYLSPSDVVRLDGDDIFKELKKRGKRRSNYLHTMDTTRGWTFEQPLIPLPRNPIHVDFDLHKMVGSLVGYAECFEALILISSTTFKFCNYI